MRKYNKRTKMTIGIVIVLLVIIVIIFSLFIKKAIDIDKVEYVVSSNSVLFDSDENLINTTLEGVIKIRWGGDYYLNYNDEIYNLGSHAVVYNTLNSNISLYGTYYEVTRDNEVYVVEEEAVIESSINSRFFKLDDRKYLIIDRTIESEDGNFVATNYLLVHLDKSGNATLLNDKVSVKTITPTVLKTSSYTFDIANEKINFGGEDIDLKEIIGSTNLYDADRYDLNDSGNDSEEGATGNGSGDGTGSGAGGTGTGGGTGEGTGTGDGTGTGTGIASGTTQGNNTGFNNNYSNNVSDNAVSQIIKATTTTSIIRVTPSIGSISVDYVIYDPDSEYTSVYVEVENTDTGNINTVYLSKSETNVVINNLTPSTVYNLEFKYNTSSRSGIVFDSVEAVSTVLPGMYLSVSKVTSKSLDYVINFDSNYAVTSGQVQIFIEGEAVEPIRDDFSSMGSVNSISRSVDISSFDVSSGDTVVVRLTSLGFNTYSTVSDTNDGLVSYSFRY